MLAVFVSNESGEVQKEEKHEPELCSRLFLLPSQAQVFLLGVRGTAVFSGESFLKGLKFFREGVLRSGKFYSKPLFRIIEISFSHRKKY